MVKFLEFSKYLTLLENASAVVYEGVEYCGYDNLTEHGDMESEEALNYILEEVQPRKFDYKASKIRESLEN